MNDTKSAVPAETVTSQSQLEKINSELCARINALEWLEAFWLKNKYQGVAVIATDRVPWFFSLALTTPSEILSTIKTGTWAKWQKIFEWSKTATVDDEGFEREIKKL